jgi:hypothetical protein
MSGPKVVRIITREEIIAICKDHLAQLEAALRRWERVGRRNALLSDKDIESTRERHDSWLRCSRKTASWICRNRFQMKSPIWQMTWNDA